MEGLLQVDQAPKCQKGMEQESKVQEPKQQSVFWAYLTSVADSKENGHRHRRNKQLGKECIELSPLLTLYQRCFHPQLRLEKEGHSCPHE